MDDKSQGRGVPLTNEEVEKFESITSHRVGEWSSELTDNLRFLIRSIPEPFAMGAFAGYSWLLLLLASQLSKEETAKEVEKFLEALPLENGEGNDGE